MAPALRACTTPSGLRDSGPSQNTSPVSCTRIPSMNSPAGRLLSTFVVPTSSFEMPSEDDGPVSERLYMNELVYKASKGCTVSVSLVQAPVSLMAGPVAGPLISDRTSAPACTRGGAGAGVEALPAAESRASEDARRPSGGVSRVAEADPGRARNTASRTKTPVRSRTWNAMVLAANHDGTPGAARARLSAAPLACSVDQERLITSTRRAPTSTARHGRVGGLLICRQSD